MIQIGTGKELTTHRTGGKTRKTKTKLNHLYERVQNLQSSGPVSIKSKENEMKKTISKVKAAHYEAQGSIAMREHADHHYGEKTPRLGLLMLFCKDFFQTLFNCK